MRARRKHVPTHVPGLDTILCGGLLRGGVYVIRGAPGSGKTILGNQVCFAHARLGAQTAYVTLLAESHARMMLHLESVSFFDTELADRSVRYLSAYGALMKNGLSGVLELLRSELPSKKARKDASVMLVIDGFLALSDQSSSVPELKKFIQELQLYADLIGATVLLLAGPVLDESAPEYTMVDGMIELREELHGLRAYRKVRAHSSRLAAAIAENIHGVRVVQAFANDHVHQGQR